MKKDPDHFELRNAPYYVTPEFAVCNVTKAIDIAWFFSAKDAEEYITWKNSCKEKNEKT